MIKANELRIGNIIGSIHTDITREVDLFLFNEIFDDQTYLDHLKPIPLTEEWLVRFGAKRFCKDFNLKGIIIHTRKRGFVLRKSVPVIKYVHSLQNLIHALTNEELTIK